MAGLAVRLRAQVSGGRFVDTSLADIGGWSATAFARYVEKYHPQFMSLVPTQLHDIVSAKMKPGPHCKAILVGGGATPIQLWNEAISLSWPLLSSYAMTECASTVAIGEHPHE